MTQSRQDSWGAVPDAAPPARALPRPVLWLFAAAGIVGLALLLACLTGRVADAPLLWRATSVAGSLLPAALCVLAARALLDRSRSSVLLAAGMASWAAGFAVYFGVYEHSSSVPVPSVADALWLGWYGLTFAALLIMARPLLPARRDLLAVHVLVGMLTVAAVMASVLVGPIVRAGGGDGWLVATALAYPAMDVVLVGLLVAVVASAGWRLNLRWGIVGCALLLQIIGDSVYAWQLATGVWAWGGPIEAIWPLVQLGLAAALWAPDSLSREKTQRAEFGLAMPLGFAAVSIGLLVIGNFIDPGPSAAVLAVAALAGSSVLVALAVRELGRLRDEVRTDALTGLANHRRFHEAFAAQVGRAHEQDRGLVLLLGDLDGFKLVNDRLGQAEGDLVLRRSADVLRRCFDAELVARLGGDKFAVVLPGDDLEEALGRAKRASERIAALGEGLGISWGAGTLEIDGPSPELLLVRADLALYEAKRTLEGSRPRPEVPASELQRRQLEAYARDVRAGYARERRIARDLDDSYMATVLALSAAVEAKDDVTGGHIHRVRDLGLLLAAAICPEDLKDPQLAYGFLLHDIGKLRVPDAILTKPGKLDDEEWAIMRSHPRAGLDILAPIPFLGRGLDVVAHHHERWDGGGYPDGLAGEDIPLWARVFAVVDTVDAMTADRPYRRGLSFQTAVDEVLTQAGRQFDPACAEAFAALPLEQVLPLLEQHDIRGRTGVTG